MQRKDSFFNTRKQQKDLAERQGLYSVFGEFARREQPCALQFLPMPRRGDHWSPAGVHCTPLRFPKRHRKCVSSRAALRRGDLPVGSPIFASTAFTATPYQEIATGTSALAMTVVVVTLCKSFSIVGNADTLIVNCQLSIVNCWLPAFSAPFQNIPAAAHG